MVIWNSKIKLQFQNSLSKCLAFWMDQRALENIQKRETIKLHIIMQQRFQPVPSEDTSPGHQEATLPPPDRAGREFHDPQ